MRTITNLNADWKFTEKGEASLVSLPHTWNAKDGQDGGNDYFRGTCTYEKKLGPVSHEKGERVYLEINGAAMTSEVFLNGKKLNHHEGGYSRFYTDLTETLNDENDLRITCNNGFNDHVYPQYADFTFYGGLYRDVNLLTVPETHFDLSYAGSQGLKVTPEADLASGRAKVKAEAWIQGNADAVVFTLGDLVQTAAVKDDHAETVFTLPHAHLWDGLKDPYLYTMRASLPEDEISARFGIRKFEINAEKGFLLNGRSYPLRGVSRHQDRKDAGNALSRAMQEEDIDLILDMGANAVRLAHYQHAQAFYDLCDEKGLVVWAEIPMISMFMKKGRDNTLSQMKELVAQNYNHPCIAVWGLSNEITAAGSVDEDMLENHRALNDLCHTMDPTRQTTMANVFMLGTDSPILQIPDVNTYNLYFGWYLGELEENEQFFDTFRKEHPDMPMGLSEYGADANIRFHSSHPFRGDYSEEYQCLYHEHMLEMISRRPWLWCTFVWNMFDFAADGRDEGGEHGLNQKGLVSFDRKTKKDAFYIYKAYWSSDPFVHIAGKRYVNRAEEQTEISVYSNQKEVSLYANGKLIGTRQGEHVFTFNVDLAKDTEVKAVSGDLIDTALFHKVQEADSSYLFHKQADAVANWFQGEAFDPSCYSIEDTMAVLQSNPKTAALMGQLMAKMNEAAGSRGDIAEKVKNNPALQKMLARQKLSTLLRQGGADKASIQAINGALQKIKKEG
jgi:beta-galactosidase